MRALGWLVAVGGVGLAVVLLKPSSGGPSVSDGAGRSGAEQLGAEQSVATSCQRQECVQREFEEAFNALGTHLRYRRDRLLSRYRGQRSVLDVRLSCLTDATEAALNDVCTGTTQAWRDLRAGFVQAKRRFTDSES